MNQGGAPRGVLHFISQGSPLEKFEKKGEKSEKFEKFEKFLRNLRKTSNRIAKNKYKIN